ncbi:CDP-glycerol glycerophosphotransferase family protein [Butyrivibrio sp. XPD2002]|uniref:CDP-glycerol glycerophosphotransferase family protein n=1 Tax=Butyrivibrio sp. XPD2002 TaxID=1280665 RepID=UPI00041B2442|nr:CDP-glycerol glycerophosphotransferase family protein [Butyrivibrio sp. XPD2002]
MRRTVIYGAGLIAENIDYTELRKVFDVYAFFDRDVQKLGKQISGYTIYSDKDLIKYVLENNIECVLVAIGNIQMQNEIIAEISEKIKKHANVYVTGYQEAVFYNSLEWDELNELLSSQNIDDCLFDAGFFWSSYSYFYYSNSKLVEIFHQRGSRCIMVFPEKDSLEWSFAGVDNLRRIIRIINDLKKKDIICIFKSNHILEKCEIKLCFGLGYDHHYIPFGMDFGPDRKNVLIQVTPIRTHLYHSGMSKKETKNSSYNEQVLRSIDYYIGSEYFCDWICKNNELWQKKVLRFGYPRLDNLYESINEDVELPDNWKERCKGKTVFLSTVIDPRPLFKFFTAENPERVMIWRPHPLTLKRENYIDEIMKYEEEYSVIIDMLPNYYASCSISDALISNLEVSLNLNYLFYNKPILCILRGTEDGDYEEQAWYKAMYKATGMQEIGDFIKMIGDGKDYQKEEMQVYRDYMTTGFDGKVCERIYYFFQN